MHAQKLPDGKLLIPVRVEGPNGLVGDGMRAIGPEHPDYKTWLADLEKFERENAPIPRPNIKG